MQYCEDKGYSHTDLSIHGNAALFIEHLDHWTACHEQNGRAPSPHSLYNKTLTLHKWVKFLLHHVDEDNVGSKFHHALAELAERKREYKRLLGPHRMKNITAEKRKKLKKFLELEDVQDLLAKAIGFLRWMQKTIKKFTKKEFALYQSVLLLLTYYQCGKLSFLILIYHTHTHSHNTIHFVAQVVPGERCCSTSLSRTQHLMSRATNISACCHQRRLLEAEALLSSHWQRSSLISFTSSSSNCTHNLELVICHLFVTCWCCSPCQLHHREC